MPEITHALVTLRLDARQREVLGRALKPARITFADRRDRAVVDGALETADVAFIGGQVDGALLRAPALRWVHCDHAGLERSTRPEVLRRDLLLTGSAGRSAPALAEHALMFMLALSFGAGRLHRAQSRRDWRGARRIVRQGRPLSECTLGIVGAGHTGRALASRAKALGMRVLGYRRRAAPPPEGFDHVYSRDAGDRLDPLLGAADFLVLAASLNDESAGLVGERELALLGSGAFVINVGRGGLVDERALVRALDRGEIAGAGLDVFAAEPLPKRSPLWRHPKVLVTPHARPTLRDRDDRSLRQLVENVDRYRAGMPLANQASARDVYSGADRGTPPTVARPAASPADARPAGSRRQRARRRRGLERSIRLGLRYPLAPTVNRLDVVRHPIGARARIETFWKHTSQGAVVSASLFALDREVLRFDCTGDDGGHFHVANRLHIRRISLPELNAAAQLDRALFEIERNLGYYLMQNPKRSVRRLSIDADALAEACRSARRSLLENVSRSGVAG